MSIYHNEAINKMRKELEHEFREQYDISCKNNDEFSGKFKAAFEEVAESFYQLDKLIRWGGYMK